MTEKLLTMQKRTQSMSNSKPSAACDRSSKDVAFGAEQVLVDHFVRVLAKDRSPWGCVRLIREFDYSRGRTDIVAFGASDTLIAIEAKLKDWKRALHQAYRNTCFAHQSFVLLPKSIALTAFTFQAEFDRRRVGLCYLDDGKVVVLQDSPHTAPLEPWLASAAIARFC